jgi:hypothetical protein
MTLYGGNLKRNQLESAIQFFLFSLEYLGAFSKQTSGSHKYSKCKELERTNEYCVM